MKRTMTVIGVLCVSLAARADVQRGSQSLQLSVGSAGFGDDLNIDNGDNKLKSHNGSSGGFQYLYFVSGNPAIGIGPDILWTDVHDKHGSSFAADSDAHAASHIATYQAVVKLAFPRGRWRPYVLGGGGFARSSLQSYIADIGTSEVRQTFDSVSYGAVGTWGAGLDWFPREHFYLGLELRDSFITRHAHQPTAFGTSQGVQSVRDPASVGTLRLTLGYKFGHS